MQAPWAGQLNRKSGSRQKDLTGERPPLIAKARPVSKGEPNGLESTENRRSVGRNGNQHVYVRDPQVSGANCDAEPRQQWRGFPVGSPGQ